MIVNKYLLILGFVSGIILADKKLHCLGQTAKFEFTLRKYFVFLKKQARMMRTCHC